MVQARDDIVGLDSGILMHPQIWVTSGHVAEFNDPMVECATCKRRYRVDEFPGAEDLGPAELLDPGIVARLGLACPNDGGPLSAPRRFNLMLKTFLGPVEDEAAVVYLRPETAQGIYVNYRNVRDTARKKIPFGIAQIGKAFRNEISPGNFVFRMREFEQMEMQYFVRPETAAGHFEDWLPRRKAWYEAYGVTPERLRFREHRPDELAHYAKKAVDVEYRFPFGWKELEGIHNRGDWDLGRHAKESGENLEYFDPATEEHFIPWIVETSAGADRAAFTFLIDAYREEEVRGEKRVVLGLHPTSLRTRSPSCRCSRSAARSSRCATASRTTSSATRWPSTTTRPRSASSTGARTRSGRRGASRWTSTRSRTATSPFETATR